MPKTRAIGATAVMLSVLAVAGCSGGSGHGAASPTSTGAKGTASGELTPPQTSTSSAPSSTTTTPTANGTEAGAPGVPKAARQHTEAGAQAFAAYYLDRVNSLYRAPKSGTLKPLESKGCDICTQTDGELAKMAKQGQRYDRDQIKYKMSGAKLSPTGDTLVRLVMHQQPARLLAADGTVLSTTPTPVVNSVVAISWVAGKGWRVEDVANDEG